MGIPIIRADKLAIIKRNTPVGRFIVSCAEWVIGGWKIASPRFDELLKDAVTLVFGNLVSAQERQEISRDLIKFLKPVEGTSGAYAWLSRLKQELFRSWALKARSVGNSWEYLDELILKVSPRENGQPETTLNRLTGKAVGSGAINLSTFHSSKGREFRAVILLGMNSSVIPNYRARNDPKKMGAERREFYVAVTRAKEHLHIVYKSKAHSEFVSELYQRTQKSV